MSDERDKQIKHHAKEILRLFEAEMPDVKKKTRAKISPKKEPPDHDINENPQNTLSGISWSYMGNMVLFKVPYKFKDGFKTIIKDKCKELARWNKSLKVWELHEDHVTEELLEHITMAQPEWLLQQQEEHKL